MSEQIEIREAPSGGLGAFVKRPLRQGELIVEQITLIVSASHLPGPKSTWREVMMDMRNNNLEARHVDEAMNKLDQKQIDEFRATYADATSDLHQSSLTNVGPYLNHSCTGNIQYSFDEASATVHLRALQDIAKGDQLCLTYYVDSEWMDLETRRGELHLMYDFTCGCPLCGDPERVVQSDELRKGIRPLQAKLKGFVESMGQGINSSISWEEATQDADRYIELVERELGGINGITGLPYRADVRLAAAYRLAAKCQNDDKNAERLHQKATRIGQICFGPDSPHLTGPFLQ